MKESHHMRKACVMRLVRKLQQKKKLRERDREREKTRISLDKREKKEVKI